MSVASPNLTTLKLPSGKWTFNVDLSIPRLLLEAIIKAPPDVVKDDDEVRGCCIDGGGAPAVLYGNSSDMAILVLTFSGFCECECAGGLLQRKKKINVNCCTCWIYCEVLKNSFSSFKNKWQIFVEHSPYTDFLASCTTNFIGIGSLRLMKSP